MNQEHKRMLSLPNGAKGGVYNLLKARLEALGIEAEDIKRIAQDGAKDTETQLTKANYHCSWIVRADSDPYVIYPSSVKTKDVLSLWTKISESILLTLNVEMYLPEKV